VFRFLLLALSPLLLLPACSAPHAAPRSLLLTVEVECPRATSLPPQATIVLLLDETPLTPRGSYSSGLGVHLKREVPLATSRQGISHRGNVHQVELFGDPHLIVPGGRYELRVKVQDGSRVLLSLLDHLDVFVDQAPPQAVHVRLQEGAPF